MTAQASVSHMSEAEFQTEVIRLLTKLNKSTAESVSGRENFDQTVMISATTPWQVDYRNRKHIYLWSGTSLTLTVEDIGTQTITANAWNDISHPHGVFLYAQGQATNVPVRIRQTDETLPVGGSSGGGGGGAVTAAAGSYAEGFSPDIADIETSVANIPPLGQALAAASVPVVLTALQQTALTPPAAITGFALDATLQSILTDTGDIETSVAQIPADPAREGGNLATIVGAIVAGLMQVNISKIGGQAAAMAGSDGQTAANVPMEVTGFYNPGTPGIERQRTPSIFKLVSTAVTAGTPVSVWTPAGGKKFRILGWALSLDVSGGMLVQDTTGVTVIRLSRSGANLLQANPPIGNGYLSTAANNQVFVDVTASGNVSGTIFGCEE